MNNVLVAIKVAYDDMGRAEKRIAEWITEHNDQLFTLSITELAAKCGCGEATIVRFARRLGLSGYQELKISLARESGNPILELFVDSMASLVFRMIRQTVDVADYSEDGVKEHTLLISALRAGDPDEAEKITRHHLEASFNKYNFRTQG